MTGAGPAAERLAAALRTLRQAHRWDAETAASQVVPAAVAHLRPVPAKGGRSKHPA